MRSRDLWVLARMDVRELLASRAFWILLLLLGPLVGHAFLAAVALYAEASGGSGTGALPQGLDPLDGILAPTLGAYDLACTLLWPFVAIRLLSAEKQSGALRLLLQAPPGPFAQVAVKAVVLLAAFVCSLLPGLAALALWASYGGHLGAAPALTLVFGHFLRALLATAVALFAAAVTESASTAAIVALAFTVGTWALDFIAAGRGGLLKTLAAFTPAAALRDFEQGLLRLDTAVVFLAASVGLFAASALFLPTGRGARTRISRAGFVAAATCAACVLGGLLRPSWDFSEDRRSSFSRAEEAALRELPRPLSATLRLAPEDPRLADLERSVLVKLRRVRPDFVVHQESTGVTGLFEAPGSGYGEIRWRVGEKEATSRSTNPRIVLDQLCALGGVTPASAEDEPPFPGYPLVARPRGAAVVFFAGFPLLTAVLFALTLRSRSRP